MKPSGNRRKALIAAVAATFVFAALIKTDSLLGVANFLAKSGWPLLPILVTIVAMRLATAGFAVLVLFPWIWKGSPFAEGTQGRSPARLAAAGVGLVSFAGFILLAAAISLALGIFKGDLTALLASPDLRPDPDVVGWGYFLLALVPGIWEELAFRGRILSGLRGSFTNRSAILLSSLFFGLYHFSNLITQPPDQAVPGAIMALFFGVGWGYLTVYSGSLVPAMVAHYLVDAPGLIFLSVDAGDPVLATGFFLLLTLLYPVFNILLAKAISRKEVSDAIHRPGLTLN